MRGATRTKREEHRPAHIASVLAIALALCGCRKEKQADTGSARGSGSAQQGSGSPQLAAVQDAAPGDATATTSINLLHAVPSTIRVSSKVYNRTIKPEHIADGSMDTAWNSATGELKGAWVEVSVDGAAIDSIKLTVGHTGHSAKGEDYFTMNPRIRAVKLDDDGKPLGTFELDITKRELQTIRVAPKGTLRITVGDIEPGSKKTWRETAISELEVWGTPAAGWTAPKQPLVPAVVVAGLVEQAPDPCADIEQDREEFNRTHDFSGASGPGAEDHAYPPTCEELTMKSSFDTLSAPWSGGVAYCYINDEIYGPKSCALVFQSGGRTFQASAGDAFDKSEEIEVTGLEEKDAIPGGANELVVTWNVSGSRSSSFVALHPRLRAAIPFRRTAKTMLPRSPRIR